MPASGTARGGHHPLARKLCGHSLADHRELAVEKFVQQLRKIASDAVIISSETLAGLLQRECGEVFFRHISDLDLEPKLVLFPRHQPQWINSRYTEAARSCSFSESFETFAHDAAQRPSLRYSPFIELSRTYHAELIARPFNAETMAKGLVPTFLEAIGLDASQFGDTNVRRNPGVGPFTIAVGRGIARRVAATGRTFKWQHSAQCKSALLAYLEKNALADSGYCGLTTSLAHRIEEVCRDDNEAFAKTVWGVRWEEAFAGEVGQEFVANDFDVCPPDETTQRVLARSIDEMMPVVDEILRDATLASDAPWNDLRRRRGLPAGQTQNAGAAAGGMP